MNIQRVSLALTLLIAVWPISTLTHRASADTPSAAAGASENQQLLDRAIADILAGRMLDALQALNALLRRDPASAQAYYNRGNVRYFRREFEAALNDYSLAMAHSPGFAAAAMNRGVVFSNLDRLDDALEDLDLAAELDPANPDVFYNRAIVHVKRGSMDRALADYDSVIQRDVGGVNLAAARARLKALLTRVDDEPVTGRERDQKIIGEIEHARNVEQFLDFAGRTCIEHGDDVKALAALAARDGWEVATENQLSDGSTSKKKLIGGWIATTRLGSMAIVQGQSTRDSNVQTCLITAKLGDTHWFDDFVTSFTSRFGSPRLVVSELNGGRLSRQVVVREDQTRVEVVLAHRTESKVLTLNVVHGAEIREKR